MKLSSYTRLIKQLPYREQAFETSFSTWEKYHYDKTFAVFLKKVFITERVKISRQDLFELCNCNSTTAIFSIIFWGYPRNMRGDSFDTVLQNLDSLNNIVQKKNRNLNIEEYSRARIDVKGTGAGLSTFTKLLYFYNFKIEGYRCLILDSRIISVLQKNYFEELSTLNSITEINKDKLYFNYLKLMSEIAKCNGYEVDQLELFLFMFGNNLKQPNNTVIKSLQ